MKKALVFLAIMALLNSFTSVCNAAFFADTDEHWAENNIDLMYNLGAFAGEGNLANPGRFITRGEFIMSCIKAIYSEDAKSDSMPFEDVSADMSAASYIAFAYQEGIVHGNGYGSFYPDSYITREEIAIITLNIKLLPKIDLPDKLNFSDIKEYRYTEQIKTVVANGIFAGYEDNTFRPYNNITIAEGMTVITKLLGCIQSYGEEAREELEKFGNQYFESDINYASNFAHEHSTGLAKRDLEYRDDIRTSTLAGNVVRQAYNRKLTDWQISGMIAKLAYTGEIEFDNNGFKSVYNVEVYYDVIKRGDSIKVFNARMVLLEKMDIVAAWSVISSKPPKTSEYMTHIIPNGYVLRKDAEKRGVLYDYGGGLKMCNKMTKELVEGYQNIGLRVWAIYYTESTLEETADFLRNPEMRTKIVKYLTDDFVTKNITGLNFDFESLAWRESSVYCDHVRELTLALHEVGAVTSFDGGTVEKRKYPTTKGYDHNRLIMSSDYFMLLAYDQYYSKSPTPGPVSEITWVNQIIDKVLTEVPADRLVLGIPFYVKYWELDGNKILLGQSVAMNEIWERIPETGVTYERMPEESHTIATWYVDGIEHKVWLDDEETLRRRLEFVDKYNLIGVCTWRLGQEEEGAWDIIHEYMK